MPSLEDLKELVDTIVIVMMENRSFDHILGHLSYKDYDNRQDVNGLRGRLKKSSYANPSEDGELYYPFVIGKDRYLPSDAPHNRDEIKEQMAPKNNRYTMSGFVKSYHKVTQTRTKTPEVMGFFPPEHVQITNFLADNFAVCDRWFSPIPTSTQPNRLIAFTGDSTVDDTKVRILNPRNLLFDWLSDRGIKWRVYHDGISFFLLFGMFTEYLSDDFRPFEALPIDISNNDEEFPQVIVIEPSYEDAPHIGSDQPNDNHAPLPVGPGELFLQRVYRALTLNPERWAKTVMILTYDEHGGFFDHEPPLQIPYDPPGGEYTSFTTTGPRVPSIIVSPLVKTRSVYHGEMDHTSILQFIAERFAPHESGYSNSVNKRRDCFGIQSVSKVLNRPSPRSRVPRIKPRTFHSDALLDEAVLFKKKKTPLQQMFEEAAVELMDNYSDETKKQFKKLWEWRLTYHND